MGKTPSMRLVDKIKHPKFIKKLKFISLLAVLALLEVAAVLFITEAGLRAFTHLNYGDRYYLWPPYLSRVNQLDEGLFIRVDGTKNFYINSLGLRGSEMSQEDEFRILSLGGSTTEQGLLDEKETWSYLLGENLSRDLEKKIWVGNGGRRGGKAADHLLQLQYFVPQLPQVDTVIILLGVNDFMRAINPQYQPHLRQIDSPPTIGELDQAFYIHPFSEYGLKGSATWNYLKKIKVTLFGRKLLYSENQGKPLLSYKAKRYEAAKLSTQPDIAAGLDEYEYYLRQLIKLSRDRGVRLVLVNQPYMWQKNMSDQQLRQLWFGCIDSGEYSCYQPEVLAEGMDRYNQRLLTVCEDEAIDCIDLAAELPQDLTVFQDGIHFNETGSASVARVLSEKLKEIIFLR